MYNRDSNIMRKLLGRTAPDTSAGDATSGSASGSFIPANYRPPRAQDATYVAGVPISCIDLSPDRRTVALGGPHILKTLVFDDQQSPTPPSSSFSSSPASSSSFHPTEGVDIRAAILSQSYSGPRASSVADQLNIRDVKWHGNNTLFTACASGRILAYDIARLAAGDAHATNYIHIQEDSRQVITLDVNPHLKSWLLSGSQDGFVRIFDTANPVHTRQGFVTFRQRFAGLRCIDPVRKVTWSPTRGHELAVCTDSGIIVRWDVRQPAKPLQRVKAHEKACTSIAWHPDGDHLLSAGSDAKLHVWEMGSDSDNHQKPKWTLKAPAPVAAVAWRPPMWSATAQARRAAQFAITYEETTAMRYGTAAVHVWDMSRPGMPYKEIERFEQSPSALLWRDQDMLWTVGGDGIFNQCDVAFAPRAVDRQPTSAVDFSPRGDVVMFLDERPDQPRPRTSMPQTAAGTSRSSHATSSLSPRTPILSLSRSESDEDVVGSFLSPRRRTNHKRRPSDKALAMTATPPSSSGIDDPKRVLGLEQSIKVTGTFKPQQAMASGHVPGARTVPVYHFLSTAYLETLVRELPRAQGGKPLLESVTCILEQFARAAERASLFRLSQTWRVLAFTTALLLKRRAQYHLETRISRSQRAKHEMGRAASGRSAPGGAPATDHAESRGDDTPRRILDDRQSRPSGLSDVDSTSNVPTPIAKPADHGSSTQRSNSVLHPIAEPETLDIGPNVQGPSSYKAPRQRLDSVPISFMSEESDRSQPSITEGYDFYDMEALSHAVGVPIGPEGSRGRMLRHDSTDSYGQLFSISAGSKGGGTGSPKRPSLQSNHKGSDFSDYQSRIRGKELPETQKPVSNSPEDVFMISQTTMQSDEYPSQQSYPSQPSYPSQDSESQPNASSMPPKQKQQQQQQQLLTPTITQQGSAASSTPSDEHPEYSDPSPNTLDTDYLPWPDDPAYPHPIITSGFKPASIPSIDPYHILQRALEFESRTSALNASAMVLLFRPLVPESVIDIHQASTILRQHYTRLCRMGLLTEAALLRSLCIRGWPEGLPNWGDSFPAIFAAAQQDVRASLACSSCHRPREIDPVDPKATVWICERCRAVMNPCAVCGHRDPEPCTFDPIDTDPSTLSLLSGWWYCPGCGHGGHASCLHTWHAPDSAIPFHDLPNPIFSGGCCPLDGCGHPCLPGKYRGQTTASRADDTARAASDRVSRTPSGAPSPRSSIRSDAFDVPQSRAVGVAREVLGRGGSSGGAAGGILSSSPSGRGERERRKSVKFARP